MRNHKVLRRLCPLLLAAGLSGCAQSTVGIKSYAAKDVHVEIKRLMIVVNVGQFKANVEPYGIRISPLKAAFADALSKCGIAVSLLSREQLSAIDDSKEAVRTFSPDALLFIERKYAESGEAEGEELYSAGIIDIATKKMVWNARIDMSQGRSRDETLATAIVDRLKSDTILGSSCSEPVAPQRSL